ncbi:hypothetical protein FRC20_007523 [Serendipita sp. 405]|nr:hypothetical protein FRC15_007444 [Serendipita sp. 397]KAG8834088.1 hypothetical protein FRC20_007523 [Serendipita sp. 405]
MRHIGTLKADLSGLKGALREETGSTGKSFYRVDYQVAINLGGTQLQAKLQWKENGILREGPVEFIPDVME